MSLALAENSEALAGVEVISNQAESVDVSSGGSEVVQVGLTDLETAVCRDGAVSGDSSVGSVVREGDGELTVSSPEHRGKSDHWLDFEDLMSKTLPHRSKILYLKAYSDLEAYLRKENELVEGVIPSQHEMMNYFHYLKNVKLFAPSTIWYIQ